MEHQLELFPYQLELFPCGPLFGGEVWDRAKELKSLHRSGAALLVEIRLSDDLLSDDDRQFFIKVRQAVNLMSNWGGFH